ncbi:uncharacterized protein F5147DRAFT_773777 [Suillus discolor]|uniref:Uncharacterized protein n=1 Tax=Suillus discolor TaxID=1912936 RepID=A0A9P7F6K1_9AGAM|nr:uncharacterized protein F5147DRAFT_773777 [Suillus discolor]KAG2108193.1 hypothetical protein F5147DRAFT_773777 [Suillus discolor]
MSKQAATPTIAPEAHIKRTKYIDARKYLDTEADIDLEGGETEGIEDEDDCSSINDHDSEDGHTAAAWDILEEYLTLEMNFSQMEAKLVSHLGSQYHEEDWTEATRALFSADEDNTQALANLHAIKARHILPAKVATHLRGSIHQSACAWFDKVADIERRFTSSCGPSEVDASSQPVPSSSEITHQMIKRFIQDKISSSHAYYLLEVEFTDNPTLLAHWESVLDVIVDAVTHEARLQIFDTQAFHVVENISSAASAAVSDQSSRGIAVFEKPVSSMQDDKLPSVHDLLTWLITMPSAQLKSKDFEVYTHSMLPGHLCIKAENTVIIRKAWPSTHTNCFFSYRPICGQYRHDVGYAYSYDPQTDIIMLLVASREVPGREVGKDPHMPHLYNHPNNISSSAGRNKTYLHGLLALKLNRNAVVEIPIPAPESIVLHQESRCNPAFVQSALHVYATQHWIEGDLVRVRAGEMFGCTVKIQCVDMCTRSASAYMEESVHIKKISHEPIMFAISDLERKFCVGDSVRVLDSSSLTSQLKGKTEWLFKSTRIWLMYSTSHPNSNSLLQSIRWRRDHVVVTEGFYVREFGVISKVDTKTQTLAFFLDSLHQHIWVPIRMMAFNPNPTALRHTHERGYDVVAGDIIQAVRGDPLCASGTVLRVNLDDKTLTFKDMRLKKIITTSIMHVARIGGRADRDPMQHFLGKEQELSWKGVLLTGVYLPLRQLREFLRLARGSFIQPPHITPPQTPCHSPPPSPDISRVDQTIPAVEVLVWNAPIDSSVIDRYPLSTGLHNDRSNAWSFNEADREERQLHPPSASASSSNNLTAILHDPLIAELCYNWHMKMRIANPSSDWGSYLNRIIDTVAPDPFLLQKGPVKDGEIPIRYSSRAKNKGMKEDPIPIKYILPEPPTGKDKKFTLI